MSGHLDGPPPGPPDPPYIPGDLGAPSAEEFARRRATPEPERNPQEGWTPTSDGPTIIYAHPEDYVWGDLVNEGHRQNWTRLVPAAAFDAVVAERDKLLELREVAAERYDSAWHTMKDARDAAIAAGQKLADAGDKLAEVVARVCGEGHPALAAWRRTGEPGRSSTQEGNDG
jgi:hypothetical protein